VDIGPRLRQARERSRIPLRELARRVGVSASLISQVERGRAMPSVGTLFRIADVLDIVVDEVFRNGAGAGGATVGGSPGGVPTPVQRRADRETIRLASGVTWERLTPMPDPDVEFLYTVYEAGAESCKENEMVRHGGREYGYVLSGRLGVKVGFESYELAAGDSITFDGMTPHRLWNPGRERAVTVWAIFRRHGDLHVRHMEGRKP
jgi:transcriptional regulator with XRE-family HTH domain/quercetin dioxygenase-like cupin family protein